VRYQIDTIEESGALLLLSLSPPITPKVRSGLFLFSSRQLSATSGQQNSDRLYMSGNSVPLSERKERLLATAKGRWLKVES
jgi:hypothetical protein